MTDKIQIHPNEFSTIRLTHYLKIAFPQKSVMEVKNIVELLQKEGKPIVIPRLTGHGLTVQVVVDKSYKMSAEESDSYWEFDPLTLTFSNPDYVDEDDEIKKYNRIEREWNRDYRAAIDAGDREAAMRALVLLDQNPWLMCASAS